MLIFANNPIATQSGKKNPEQWFLKFMQQDDSSYLESYMGWFSSEDMHASELCIPFATKELAADFAEKNNLEYQIIDRQSRKVLSKSYGENFTESDYE